VPVFSWLLRLSLIAVFSVLKRVRFPRLDALFLHKNGIKI
jgi:hypothetical protein